MAAMEVEKSQKKKKRKQVQQQDSQDKTKKNKKKRKSALEEAGVTRKDLEEAERLHGLLFGRLSAADNLGKEEDEGTLLSDFRRDVLGDVEVAGEGKIVSVGGGEAKERKKQPAWVDEEETEIKVRVDKGAKIVSGTDYVSQLRARHAKINPGTDWAQLPSEKKRRRKGDYDSDSEFENDDYADILRRNDELVVKDRTRLPQGLIEISRMKDGNIQEPSTAVVRSVEFHKNGQILMTAGFDKKLRFFQIDGLRNPKVQSIFLENFPIQKARFVPDGSKVVATARRKTYVTYDLVQGKVENIIPLIGREERSLESFEVSPDSKLVAFMGNEGYILLSSLGTKQLIGTLKMNGSVRSLAFTNDGRQLLSCGGDGEVYCWDMSTRRCIYKARDEGCVKNTALSVSANDEYFCTGSDGGVVNVYNREDFLGGVSKPLKTLMNLTTSIDNVKFNHDTQILAIASRMKKDALRLVHVPSFTVFSNWPTPKSGLQYVHSLDFSPRSGYLAAGNGAGKVLLYRLRHYDHA